MIAKITQRIKLYVTPTMLRNWADRMEKAWSSVQCGDSVVWSDISLDDNIDLSICFNQDELDREKRL